MKVLVVVDVQDDFCDKDGVLAPSDPTAAGLVIDNILDLIAAHRAMGSKIIFTQDIHHINPFGEPGEDPDPDNYENTREGKHLPIPHCIECNRGADLIPEIHNNLQRDDIVIQKGTFGSLKLAEVLQKLDASDEVDEVIFVGFDTDYCVISNAVIASAALPNAVMTVVESCCYGVTKDDHWKAIKMMEHLHIDVA